MKYYIFLNKKWDYDDLVSEEFIVLETPEGFDCCSLSMIAQMFADTNQPYLWEGKHLYIPLGKKGSFGARMVILDLSDVLFFPNPQRVKFINWLGEHHRVRVLPAQYIGQPL